MRRLSVAVIVALAAITLRADCPVIPTACNTISSSNLSDACLDENVLRYELWSFHGEAGQIVNAIMNAATYTPKVSIVRPDFTIVATGSGKPAKAKKVLTETGTWYVLAQNTDVGVHGPYTLQLSCSDTSGGGGDPGEPPATPTPVITVSPTQIRVLQGGYGEAHVQSLSATGSEITLSATAPRGLKVDFFPSVFGAPGTGGGAVRVTVDGTVAQGSYDVSLTATDSVTHARVSTRLNVAVTFYCEPPRITRQPFSDPVPRGSSATVSLLTGGTEPITYQWYAGDPPSTFFPVKGATSSTLVTPTVMNEQRYWVRTTNNCGTYDSQVVIVQPFDPPPSSRRRAIRR